MYVYLQKYLVVLSRRTRLLTDIDECIDEIYVGRRDTPWVPRYSSGKTILAQVRAAERPRHDLPEIYAIKLASISPRTNHRACHARATFRACSQMRLYVCIPERGSTRYTRTHDKRRNIKEKRRERSTCGRTRKIFSICESKFQEIQIVTFRDKCRLFYCRSLQQHTVYECNYSFWVYFVFLKFKLSQTWVRDYWIFRVGQQYVMYTPSANGRALLTFTKRKLRDEIAVENIYNVIWTETNESKVKECGNGKSQLWYMHIRVHERHTMYVCLYMYIHIYIYIYIFTVQIFFGNLLQ